MYLLETRSDHDGLPEEAGHALVHQGVSFDKIQRQVRQRATVVVALAGSWVRHLVAEYRQPVGIDGSLFLEVALECVGDVLQAEGAHRAAGNAVGWRGECAVDELSGHIAVLAVDQIRRGFCGKIFWNVEIRNTIKYKKLFMIASDAWKLNEVFYAIFLIFFCFFRCLNASNYVFTL